MLDINKYIETQHTLAKQRINRKNIKDQNVATVSERSQIVGEIISNKQLKCKASKVEALPHNASTNSVVPVVTNDETDSEYLPSDEDDEHIILNTPVPRSKANNNMNKIIDDGDTILYNERIENWRQSLATALTGKYNGSAISADVSHILAGNSDYNANHELQNGLCMPNYLWKQLYRYQKVGVKWLWELHQVQSGGLLGDEMGLGKTIQIIAFLAALSKTDCGKWGGLGPSLILAPATVIYQWVSHFHYWYPNIRVAVLHNSGSHTGNHAKLIRNIQSSHGILLVTYAGIVKYVKDLLCHKWHYIILDEGHKIRNPDTQVSKIVKKFETPHKLIITGSPMQNSLQELWSLFDFMRPGLLGTYKAFMDHFATPITQGGYANASPIQEATALEIAIALKNMITPYMLRRTKSEVKDHVKLPEKNEQVLFCALTQEQKDLYMGYLMGSTVRSILDKETRYGDPIRARVLVALSTLRKICNHPDLYLYEAQEDNEQLDDDKFGYWKRSGKLSVVHSLLKIWQKQGHRALIFSQSRAMICIIEQHLQNQKYKYLKMDGTVSVSLRQSLIKTFNENVEYLVFLATTRVGGLGVNLTGADRVIIYDPDWNPATDSQAKERAWRIGQKRNVTVYRLLSAGTIEEKVYQRQIFKHFLSNKVLIDPNQKNMLSTSTLQGLFSFEEPNCNGDTETSNLFKHTKVDISNIKDKHRNKDRNEVIVNNKLKEMRRRAKEISKKISKDIKNEIYLHQCGDRRDEYKKKRQLLLNPPIVEEPQVNLIDGEITDSTFENVLSELDIIKRHVKKDYEKNLLEEALNKQNGKEEETTNVSSTSNNPISEDQIQVIFDPVKNNLISDAPNIEEDLALPNPKIYKKYQKNLDKRKYCDESEVDNLLVVKKKKVHKEKDILKDNDDDYVLSKLFAKSSVKNALQHDVVIGLAEKEKKHRLKEEAMKKAKDAVKAVKFSYKK